MKYYLFIIVIFFVSCQKTGTTFFVENKTETEINFISITNGFNYISLEQLKPNEKKEIFLDFTSNNTKSDGNYNLKYKMNNNLYSKSFGYYSNGIPASKKMSIKIYKNNLIIK